MVSEQISLFDDLEIVRNFEQGRDELNLAEFPICSLYRRDASIKTLYYEDEITDQQSGDLINRKLTVTASDEFGLPCAFDDEVILALIQLTKLQRFQKKKVYFTKRQILEVLGWNTGGKNTMRVEESLKRWLGVTLTYDSAWRDRQSGRWETKGFHILEEVYFKEHQADPSGQRSYIVWNDVVFRSMKAGNLKPLDFSTFKELSCPTAKRIFRFLDKRFYHRSALRFELEDFAYQKIGIDRRYGPAAIKQKLAAGIAELERQGFINPCTKSERYRKITGGKWNIYFEKGHTDQAAFPIKVDPETELEKRMMALGVTHNAARKLFDSYPADFLREKIEQAEFLISKPDAAPKNPAGWLVRAINEDWAPPADFKSEAERATEAKAAEDRAEARKQRMAELEAKAQEDKRAVDAAEHARRETIDGYLSELSATDRQALIETALAAVPDELGFKDRKGPAGDAFRQSAIDEHVLTLLRAG